MFLVGLVDGTLPIIYADTPEQVEEERRLLYVGVTRAREHLALSWGRRRSAAGANAPPRGSSTPLGQGRLSRRPGGAAPRRGRARPPWSRAAGAAGPG